jgi:hypothetical protein
MDAFESLIKSLLEREGFWVRSHFKVNLTKTDKVAIGHQTCPRWEIDLLAYKAATNELRFVECKPRLDHRYGLRYGSFTKEGGPDRFTLFTDRTLRSVVMNRLVTQLMETGGCRPAPAVTLCLAAGKIRNEADRQGLRQHFNENGWVLWDDEWIGKALRDISNGSDENDVAFVVAKLLLRGSLG